MNQLNSIIIEGNVVRQAEISEPSDGFKVCKFALAVNRLSKKENGDATEEVSFFDVESYGKLAEICKDNGSKGRGVRVVGRLKQNRWKDNDGKNHSKVYIVSEHVEFKPVFHEADGTAKNAATKNSAVKTTEKVTEEAVAF